MVWQSPGVLGIKGSGGTFAGRGLAGLVGAALWFCAVCEAGSWFALANASLLPELWAP